VALAETAQPPLDSIEAGEGRKPPPAPARTALARGLDRGHRLGRLPAKSICTLAIGRPPVRTDLPPFVIGRSLKAPAAR